MKKLLLAVVLLPPLSVLGIGGLAARTLSGVLSAQTVSGVGPTLIPPAMLVLYRAAAATCPGLSWTVLAAVGEVESDHGRSALPGVQSGRNQAGAEGPMQFEPATFARYDLPVPPGGADPPSPYDATDSVYAAARMLCADGGADPARLGDALFAYNHSQAYVAQVLAQADAYEAQTTAGGPGGSGSGVSGAAGAVAVAYALTQVGTPYRWGGEEPGVGFDCSGLAQAAWAAAGVALPRVASEQYAAGPAVVPGQPLAPGDLVFFGPGPGDITHVGLVVDPSGVMVDAPHTGATVRVEAFGPQLGAAWGSDVYLGATAPG